MGRFLLRRSWAGMLTILLTVLFVFFLLRILPGDVAYQMLADPEEGWSAEVSGKGLDAIRKELGLDKPLHVQLGQFLWNLARGDLGRSLYTDDTVWAEIRSRLPMTLQIALSAKLIGILVGIPIGVLTAIKQDSWPDYVLRFFTILWLAIPSFWVGIMVLLGGLMWFEWSPSIGRNFLWDSPADSINQTLGPILILGSNAVAIIARMTRSTMLEVLREDYVRTARAKGLAESRVIFGHALRNALIPVVTIIGLSFGTLVSGTVILERVFTIPGVGNLFVTSITNRDYPIVQGIVFLIAASFVVINIAVDILYGWLDPRISYSDSG